MFKMIKLVKNKMQVTETAKKGSLIMNIKCYSYPVTLIWVIYIEKRKNFVKMH